MSEPMSVGPSYEGYNPTSQPEFQLASPIGFDELSYAQPQSGPDAFSYPPTSVSYPSYPTLSPHVPVQSHLPDLVDHQQQQQQAASYQAQHGLHSSDAGGRASEMPGTDPSMPTYDWPTLTAYHPRPASTTLRQQPVAPPIYHHQSYPSLPTQNQTQAAPHHFQSFQPSPAPISTQPRYAYPTYDPPAHPSTDELYDRTMTEDDYYAAAQQNPPFTYPSSSGPASRESRPGTSFVEEGYTSNFPRHG